MGLRMRDTGLLPLSFGPKTTSKYDVAAVRGSASLAGLALMRHVCQLCCHADSIRNLITPCPTCAKRDDTLLVHAQCLLRHIEDSVQHRIDTSEQEAATCATCGRPYQLKWRWRLHFTAARALSAFSLDQYCHLLGLLTMASLLLLTAWLTLHPTPAAAKHHTADDEPAHPHQVSSSSASPAAVWLAGIVLVVLLLSGVAIAQVVARLWLHQSQAVLAEDEVLV